LIGSSLAQEIWCRARTGVDGYGQPTFGTPAKLTARWLEKRKLVRNAEGEQVLSEVTVTLDAEAVLAVGDQLSADGTNYLDIITLSTSRGLGGGAICKRAYL